MNTIVVGAGEVGAYVSRILAEKGHQVSLIDESSERLEAASRDVELATWRAEGTDLEVLSELINAGASLIIACTENDERNLVVCKLAKNLGIDKAVARVRKQSLLSSTKLDIASLFAIDDLVCPELLVAQDILRHIRRPSCLDIQTFDHGLVQMHTVAIPDDWTYSRRRLRDLKIFSDITCALIHRPTKSPHVWDVLFPHGDDVLLPKDQVSFVGSTAALRGLVDLQLAPERFVRTVVIHGASLVAKHLTAALADSNISVVMIDENKERCSDFAKAFASASVICRSGSEIRCLEELNVKEADLFISCTLNDETDVLSSMLGAQVGCPSVLSTVTREDYARILHGAHVKLIDTPKVAATNRLLSLVRTKNIVSRTSLYSRRAEVLEISITENCKLIGIPIKTLGQTLPQDFLFAAIKNRGHILVPRGSSVLSQGDTVIAVCNPVHIPQLAKVF